MTQIISAITQEYVLLASDRRLTIASGPNRGKPLDQEVCKLVNLCNLCGIGYTGLATIEGDSTHEWIAKALASERCRECLGASTTIANRADSAFSKSPFPIPQMFVLAGWGFFKELRGLRAQARLISNAHNETGRPLLAPKNSFVSLLKVLTDNEELFWRVTGYPLVLRREQQLDRNLRRLAAREIGPKETLRLLMEEIVNTSKMTDLVGSKVLGFCIPRRGVERQMASGSSVMLAKPPDEQTATFAYFDEGYNELRQYGPTFVCGEYAFTDLETVNDPARDLQSSSVRILALPKPKS